MTVTTATRWCAVGAALLGGLVMLLMQLGAWAFNGMNLASSAYLIVTGSGLIAVVASLKKPQRRGLTVFVIVGSLALAALSSFFLIYRFQSGMSDGGPLYVAGVPFNLYVMYSFTAAGCAAVAALTWWSMKDALPGRRSL